jgi:asparagine synthetase A
MFIIALLALFVLLAVVSSLGLTADSRDLRPHNSLQSHDDRADLAWTDNLSNTALPPYPRARVRH